MWCYGSGLVQTECNGCRRVSCLRDKTEAKHVPSAHYYFASMPGTEPQNLVRFWLLSWLLCWDKRWMMDFCVNHEERFSCTVIHIMMWLMMTLTLLTDCTHIPSHTVTIPWWKEWLDVIASVCLKQKELSSRTRWISSSSLKSYSISHQPQNNNTPVTSLKAIYYVTPDQWDLQQGDDRYCGWYCDLLVARHAVVFWMREGRRSIRATNASRIHTSEKSSRPNMGWLNRLLLFENIGDDDAGKREHISYITFTLHVYFNLLVLLLLDDANDGIPYGI